jgi:hypothetical protein
MHHPIFETLRSVVAGLQYAGLTPTGVLRPCDGVSIKLAVPRTPATTGSRRPDTMSADTLSKLIESLSTPATTGSNVIDMLPEPTDPRHHEIERFTLPRTPATTGLNDICGWCGATDPRYDGVCGCCGRTDTD